MDGRHSAARTLSLMIAKSWRAAGRALVNKVVQAKISTILQPQMTLVVGWVVSRIGLKAGDS